MSYMTIQIEEWNENKEIWTPIYAGYKDSDNLDFKECNIFTEENKNLIDYFLGGEAMLPERGLPKDASTESYSRFEAEKPIRATWYDFSEIIKCNDYLSSYELDCWIVFMNQFFSMIGRPLDYLGALKYGTYRFLCWYFE